MGYQQEMSQQLKVFHEKGLIIFMYNFVRKLSREICYMGIFCLLNLCMILRGPGKPDGTHIPLTILTIPFELSHGKRREKKRFSAIELIRHAAMYGEIP